MTRIHDDHATIVRAHQHSAVREKKTANNDRPIPRD